MENEIGIHGASPPAEQRPKTGCKRYLEDLRDFREACKNLYKTYERRQCCCITRSGALAMGDMTTEGLEGNDEICCWVTKEDAKHGHWGQEPTCFWTHKYFFKGAYRASMAFFVSLLSLLTVWIYLAYDIYWVLRSSLTGHFCDWTPIFLLSVVGLAVRVPFNVVRNLLEALFYLVVYTLACIFNCCCCFCYGACLQHLCCLCDCPKRFDKCMGVSYHGCRECVKAMEDPDSTV